MRILGDISKCRIDKDIDHLKDIDIFLDCRGYIEIPKSVTLGFNITIITQTHDIHDFGKVTDRPVIIKKNAFIGSNVLLYNCTIGEGAIVAAGTVVRSRDVPPYMMVEGNPAEIIAEYRDCGREGKRWEYHPINILIQRKK